MKSNALPLYKTKNGHLISPSISKEAIEKMCDKSFKIVISKNKFKNNDFNPDFLIFVVGDK